MLWPQGLVFIPQVWVIMPLKSFITVIIIITNCQTYDHQWMHNVWSGFLSDNDDLIISDIHKADQQESSSQPPPSANWFWYIIEPHLYRIHFLRTEIYKMHNHRQASSAKTINLTIILNIDWSFESIWSSNPIVHPLSCHQITFLITTGFKHEKKNIIKVLIR